MQFNSLQERANFCVSNKKIICFISLAELNDEDVGYVFHSEIGYEVPVHKKYVKE